MDTLSLRIKYRPLKIGWCLNVGDIDGLRKAMRLSHILWGGRYNPLIPVNDSAWATQLAKLFRVDMLIAVSEDKCVEQFVKGCSWLPMPFLYSNLFLRDQSGRIFPQMLDLYHPIRRLYERHFKNNPKPALKVSLFQWDDDDPLRDILLANLGGFPSIEETGIDYLEMIEKNLVAEKVDLAGHAPLPPDIFKRATPNWISKFDLEPHYSVINHWDTPGFYLGSVADFDDLINYWNLRATNIDLLFYDPTFTVRLETARSNYIEFLHKIPKEHIRFDAHVSIWCKDDNERFNLAEFGESISRFSAGSSVWNGLNIKVPIMQSSEKSVLAVVEHSSGKSRISFSLPEKPCFGIGQRRRQHLVASIGPGVGLFENERETIVTPFLPELNEFYGRNCYFKWNKVRVEPESLGIIIDAWQEDLTLSALDVNALISEIFTIAGIRARQSKPGLIASRLIQQLGGLQGCRVFKIKGVRELIEKYKPDESFTRSSANQIIGRLIRTMACRILHHTKIYLLNHAHGNKSLNQKMF